MKREKKILSSFEPKRPSDGLKQRVLDAATGAAPEPVIYGHVFGKLDWGLLAASLILAAALFAMNGSGGASPIEGKASAPQEVAAQLAMFEELDIPAPSRRAAARRDVEKAEEYLREIGG